LPATALGFNPPDVDVMEKPPRRKDGALISRWVFFRYMVIGMYVGFATVGIFVWYYVFDSESTDGHTLVTLNQLMNWGKCSEWKDFKVNPAAGVDMSKPCTYFQGGKIKASTLSLTVLVVIEMLNALNALSEDGSLVTMPPWANPWLLLAMMGSMLVHFAVLYIPVMNKVFSVVPLDAHDWTYVFAFSSPVIFIDEILKLVGRNLVNKRLFGKKHEKAE